MNPRGAADLHVIHMKPRRVITAAICLVALAAPAAAGEQVYTCTARFVSQLSEDGLLVPAKLPNPELRIPPFVVVRDTGLAQGWSFGLADFKANEARVLSRGNSKNYFVAVYTFARPHSGAAIATLVVEEFTQSPKKPFLLLASDKVVTGLCE